MVRKILTAAVLLVAMTLLTGVLYPLVVTGIAQLVFPQQANGSLIERQGRVVGSSLIGQNFTGPAYFHGRPSAAGAGGYDATASSGSNLGPTNKALIDAIAERASKVRLENDMPGDALLPADLVTASGSGLDPHISSAAALLQAPRVARARGLPESQVRAIVDNSIEGAQYGIFGEERVNVLRLNLQLGELTR